MSLSLMSEVWPLDLPLGKKFVLLAICDSGHDDGEIFLCVETIAYKCGMSVRAVQQHLADLETDGFITRQERPGRSSLFTVYPMMLRAAPRHPLYEQRRKIREKHTPAKSAGVHVTPEKSAGVVSAPAESAPAPAESAGAPAESAPITVLQRSSTRRKKTTRAELSADDLVAKHGVDRQVAQDFIALRKAKRAALTVTALDGLLAEYQRAGLTIEGGMRVQIQRGWQGFSADWLKDKNNPKGGTTHDQRAATIAALTGRDREQGSVIDSTANHVD